MGALPGLDTIALLPGLSSLKDIQNYNSDKGEN
jgi:hypothetical protein